MKKHQHQWQRFAYSGKGVAPILCADCAQPMNYPPERLIVWNSDPLVAAQMLDRAGERMRDFAHRELQ